MTALPDIPRLYTALAECLAVLLVTPALMPRFSKAVTVGVTLLWAAGLSAFLGLTGNVPGGLWIPCMVTAIGFSYLYLWGVWSITLLEAGYHCARAFILAELAASVEWQLHCALWPARGSRCLCCCWRWCMGRCSASCAICSTAVPGPPGTYRSAAAPP